jgi:hypothetical protein
MNKSQLILVNSPSSCFLASGNFARYLKPAGRQLPAGTASSLLSKLIFSEFPDLFPILFNAIAVHFNILQGLTWIRMKDYVLIRA